MNVLITESLLDIDQANMDIKQNFVHTQVSFCTNVAACQFS